MELQMRNVQRRNLLLDLLRFMDLAVMTLLFCVITGFGDGTGRLFVMERVFSHRITLADLIAFLGFMLIWNRSYEAFGLYHTRRLSSQSSQLLDVLKATSLATAGILFVSVLFHVDRFSRIQIICFWASTTGLAVLSRMAGIRIQHTARLHGRNLRHMLIVGTNRRALGLASALERKPELGYHLIGFADDEWAGIGEVERAGYKRVVSLQNLPAFLRENVVDEVVICLPINSYYLAMREIAALCAEQGIITRLLAELFDLRLRVARTDYLEEFPLITLSSAGIDEWAAVYKRGFDAVASLLLIAVLSPVFLLTMLLIKLTSPGPIFFRQIRLGLNKRSFHMFKFRTMVVNAEQMLKDLEQKNEAEGPVFKLKNDPRITPLGRILRKLSIDELPQLLNVLKGDMSLVGPRPLPLRDYAGFRQDWYRRRFSVRPGISCLWQIKGRSSIGFEQWMELDMNYIDQWSFWLDMEILFKTIPAVLRGEGAY